MEVKSVEGRFIASESLMKTIKAKIFELRKGKQELLAREYEAFPLSLYQVQGLV